MHRNNGFLMRVCARPRLLGMKSGVKRTKRATCSRPGLFCSHGGDSVLLSWKRD